MPHISCSSFIYQDTQGLPLVSSVLMPFQTRLSTSMKPGGISSSWGSFPCFRPVVKKINGFRFVQSNRIDFSDALHPKTSVLLQSSYSLDQNVEQLKSKVNHVHLVMDGCY